MSDKTILNVLGKYGLDNACFFKLNTRSYNEHYEVRDGKNKYCLRCNRKPLSYNNLFFEYEVINYLRLYYNNVIPHIILTKDNKICCIDGDVFYTLFEWIDYGPKIINQNYGAADIANAAYMLADMHSNLKNFTPSVNRDDAYVYMSVDNWHDKFSYIISEVISPRLKYGDLLMKYSKKVEELISDLDVSKLEYGVNHGDYKPCNILFDKSLIGIKAIFDFDCSHKNYLLNDIVCAILSFGKMDRIPTFDIRVADKIIDSYNSRNALSNCAIKSIKTFICWKLVKDVVVFYDFNPFWWDEIHFVVDRIINDIEEWSI